MVFIEALKYPFKGESVFNKLLLLLLIPLLPLIGTLLLLGYGTRIIFQTIASEDGYGEVSGLPEWDDWMGDILRGLMSLIAYSLLSLVISLGLGLLMTPVTLVTSALVGYDPIGTRGLPLVAVFGSLLMLVTLFYAIPMAFYLQAKFAITGDFNSFFAWREAYSAVLEAGKWRMFMLCLDVLMLWTVGSIIASMGLVLLILPGLLIFASLIAAQHYMIGRWGYECGLRITQVKFKREEKLKREYA
jgi:hypothetical protein